MCNQWYEQFDCGHVIRYGSVVPCTTGAGSHKPNDKVRKRSGYLCAKCVSRKSYRTVAVAGRWLTRDYCAGPREKRLRHLEVFRPLHLPTIRFLVCLNNARHLPNPRLFKSNNSGWTSSIHLLCHFNVHLSFWAFCR